MSKIEVGALVEVVRVAEDFVGDGYDVGDVFEIVDVYADYRNYEPQEGAILTTSTGIELYEKEVEIYAGPPKDYDEDAEFAAKDADVGTWVKEEHVDEYNEIVISLSQAIADKAKQMRTNGDAMYDHPSFYDESNTTTVTLNTDDIWMNAEDVGKEVIHDTYNNDVVQAPSHYVNSKIEPIDYMADKLPAYDDGHTAFCVGNVIKYVSRAPHKGNLLQDLRKAAKYLEFAIEHEEGKE